MNNDITLEKLIEEQKARIPQIVYGLDGYYSKDGEQYYKWLVKTKRYLSIAFPNDKNTIEFEALSKKEFTPDQQAELLAILEAFVDLPQIVIDDSRTSPSTNNIFNIDNSNKNTNNQSQTQTQSFAVEIFLEAIKDDLTGRQIKGLKSVVNEAGNDLQKARSGILEKLKSFGSDVASNIVANLLTNPNIWCGL